ncbi:MAG TPA: preprotein translocase subunit SecE [Chitinophagales bacterium]|mgnify:CR=1 FL=1|nr:preprotein translocase subunit SecE [Chitinophagales bacterium]MCB9075827.1 preprotein translocase subunit SecE [Chitinophagales bacterium]HMU98967.1 preprotein translocase subunit SecE [Chitinophagales bacterium]HMV03390.1 preprotein translocase subunit SecE [Chitinophagales bacterium]HMW94140.1 preprotein translocase subunit SecE [Chitinophagales bacterium]
MEKLIEFIKASYDELMNKVTWSNANELRSNTIIVLVGSVVIAFLILLMDKVSMVALSDVIYKIIG